MNCKIDLPLNLAVKPSLSRKNQKKLWIISEYWLMPLYLQPFSDGQVLKSLENQ
jgi:hypothetical protein